MLNWCEITSKKTNVIYQNNKQSNLLEWLPSLGLLFIFALCIIICFYIGSQNSANAIPQQVKFNSVAIRNGARIHVNGDKALTAINEGEQLLSDATTDSNVKGSQIASAIANFTNQNFNKDPLFMSGVANNPSLLSELDIFLNSAYLKNVGSEYWLSDVGSRGSISWQSYASQNNTLLDNSLTALGKVDGNEYYGNEIARGSYAFNKDVSLSNYTLSAGGDFSLNNTGTTRLNTFQVNKDYFANGTPVYNNPLCLSSGYDDYGNAYRSSYVQNLVNGSGRLAFGYVAENSRVCKLSLGQVIPKGTVLVFGFMKSHKEIADTTGFLMPVSQITSTSFETPTYTAFIRTDIDLKVVRQTNSYHTMKGFDTFISDPSDITANSIIGASKSVRPVYNLDLSHVLFARSSDSESELDIDSSFSNMPDSYVGYEENKKLVIDSQSTTITCEITDDKISTEKSADGHSNTSYSDGVISVPYGAKTLTFEQDIFSTENANCIVGLSNGEMGKKFSILGKTDSNIEIDLDSIISTEIIGSKAAVSLYSYLANDENTTDLIGSVPVTFDVQVVSNVPQTIRYDINGGEGVTPDSATIMAGKTYQLHDGTTLSDSDGNPFSCWEVSFTAYGENEVTTRFIQGNESIVIPDTSNGMIVAKARYSGISANKRTDATPTVYTITWNTNAPDGATAVFSSSLSGTYNDSRSKKYDKIKLKGATVQAPAQPTLTNSTKNFAGWFTDIEGTKGKVEPNDAVTSQVNITYYAKWVDGYQVTYDATGGNTSTPKGHFSGNRETITETVTISNNVIKGPGEDPTEDNAASNGYCFAGWWTGRNGTGTEAKFGSTRVTSNLTYYANYINTTFLAPKSNAANPRTITGAKYSINQVKVAAVDIASKGTSSSYYNQYNGYMTSDSYHLYTLLSGKTGSNANDWVEFRIINVRPHDSDGSGLTFQAVHMLNDANWFSNSSTYSDGWTNSEIYKSLNSGTAYNSFDVRLRNSVKSITGKGNFWLLAFSEISGLTAGASGWGGNQYQYWSGKVSSSNWQSSNSYLKITGTRSGSNPSQIENSGCWFTRSPYKVSSSPYTYITIDANGKLGSTKTVHSREGIVPCFAM